MTTHAFFLPVLPFPFADRESDAVPITRRPEEQGEISPLATSVPPVETGARLLASLPLRFGR